MKKQKICIIGGGLTGLITAVALSKLNLSVDLISNNINKNVKTNRTTAISHENLLFLKSLNFFKFSKNEFWPCPIMKLYAKDKKEKLAEIFKLTKKKNVLYMMNNSKIITYIVEKIKKEKKIFFKTKKKYSNINFLDLLADNKALKNKIFSKYNLVILCTGSNFFLRGGIANYPGLKFSYEETAVTTTISHKICDNIVARQIFLDNEIIAFLPISNSKTSIIWSVKNEGIKAKSKSYLKKKIKYFSKFFFKNIEFSSNIEYRDLNLFLQKEYFRNRFLLFGDALHVVHPFAGQGFNMILRDLYSLSNILKRKLSLGLDIGSSDVLKEFSNETKPRNFVYSMSIDFLKKIFSYKKTYFNKFRVSSIKNINKSNFLKEIIYDFADKGLRF